MEPACTPTETTGVSRPQENAQPPEDLPRTLGIGLRYVPREVRFFASEVPLYACTKPGEGLVLLCLVHDRTDKGVVDA